MKTTEMQINENVIYHILKSTCYDCGKRIKDKFCYLCERNEYMAMGVQPNYVVNHLTSYYKTRKSRYSSHGSSFLSIAVNVSYPVGSEIPKNIEEVQILRGCEVVYKLIASQIQIKKRKNGTRNDF